MTGVSASTYAGLALMAASAITQGVQASNQNKFMAKQAKQEAEDEKTALQIRAKDRERRRIATIATQRAIYGAAGVDPNWGTPLDVAADTRAEYGREQFQDNLDTRRRIKSGRASASNYNASGSNALVGGFLNAGSQVGATMIKG